MSRITLVCRCPHDRAELLSTSAPSLHPTQHLVVPGQEAVLALTNLHLKLPATEFYRKLFEYKGTFDWNNLPSNLKSVGSESLLKSP